MHKDMNFWPEYFSVVLTENNNKMTENYVQKIWVKKVVIWGRGLFLAGFCIWDPILLFWAFFNHISGKQQ